MRKTEKNSIFGIVANIYSNDDPSIPPCRYPFQSHAFVAVRRTVRPAFGCGFSGPPAFGLGAWSVVRGAFFEKTLRLDLKLLTWTWKLAAEPGGLKTPLIFGPAVTKGCLLEDKAAQ